MATELESLQGEVERLQEVLHSDDDTSRSSVGGDLPLYIAEQDEHSDQIDEDQDVAQSETEDQKPTERQRFDITSSLDVINDLETDGDNLTTCLTFNIVYQKIIEEMLRNIEELRADNKARRDMVEGKITPKNRKRKKAPGDGTLAPAFRTPYFHLPSTGYPPPNDDIALKASRQEIDPVITSAMLWTVRERKTLIAAIRNDAMKRTLQPCLNRIDIEIEKLEKCGHFDVKKLIKERIDAINREINIIKSYSNEKLLTEVDGSKVDWLRISSVDLKGCHNATSCQLMWNNVLRPQINRFPWTKAQERKLKDLIHVEQVKDWTEISRRLACNRTPFQCLQYYEQHIRKDSVKPWTMEEDAMLQDVVNICRIGNRIPWNQVSFYLEGRGPPQCVHRYMLINPLIKHGRWTVTEDQLLTAAVEQLGKSSWTDVASHVPNRHCSQCRERYTNKLDPELKIGHWTEDEDIKLITLVRQYCTGWARIAQDMPGRTDARCKGRYEAVMRQHGMRGMSSTKMKSLIAAYKPFLPQTSKKKVRRVEKESDVSSSSDDEGDECKEEEEDDSQLSFLRSSHVDRRNPDIKQRFDEAMEAGGTLSRLVRERRKELKEKGGVKDAFLTNMAPASETDSQILLELQRLYPEKSLHKIVELARVLCGERVSQKGRPRVKRRREGATAYQLDENIRRFLNSYEDTSTAHVNKIRPESIPHLDVTESSCTSMNHLLKTLMVKVNTARYKRLSLSSTSSKMPRVILSGKQKAANNKKSVDEVDCLSAPLVSLMDAVHRRHPRATYSRCSPSKDCLFLAPCLSSIAAFREIDKQELRYRSRHNALMNGRRRRRPLGRPRKIQPDAGVRGKPKWWSEMKRKQAAGSVGVVQLAGSVDTRGRGLAQCGSGATDGGDGGSAESGGGGVDIVNWRSNGVEGGEEGHDGLPKECGEDKVGIVDTEASRMRVSGDAEQREGHAVEPGCDYRVEGMAAPSRGARDCETGIEAGRKSIEVSTTNLLEEDEEKNEEEDEECTISDGDEDCDDDEREQTEKNEAGEPGDNPELSQYQALVRSDEHQLLKRRFCSLFLWPCVMSKVRLPRYMMKEGGPLAAAQVTTSRGLDDMTFPSSTMRACSMPATMMEAEQAENEVQKMDPPTVAKSENMDNTSRPGSKKSSIDTGDRSTLPQSANFNLFSDMEFEERSLDIAECSTLEGNATKMRRYDNDVIDLDAPAAEYKRSVSPIPCISYIGRNGSDVSLAKNCGRNRARSPNKSAAEARINNKHNNSQTNSQPKAAGCLSAVSANESNKKPKKWVTLYRDPNGTRTYGKSGKSLAVSTDENAKIWVIQKESGKNKISKIAESNASCKHTTHSKLNTQQPPAAPATSMIQYVMVTPGAPVRGEQQSRTVSSGAVVDHQEHDITGQGLSENAHNIRSSVRTYARNKSATRRSHDDKTDGREERVLNRDAPTNLRRIYDCNITEKTRLNYVVTNDPPPVSLSTLTFRRYPKVDDDATGIAASIGSASTSTSVGRRGRKRKSTGNINAEDETVGTTVNGVSSDLIETRKGRKVKSTKYFNRDDVRTLEDGSRVTRDHKRKLSA